MCSWCNINKWIGSPKGRQQPSKEFVTHHSRMTDCCTRNEQRNDLRSVPLFNYQENDWACVYRGDNVSCGCLLPLSFIMHTFCYCHYNCIWFLDNVANILIILLLYSLCGIDDLGFVNVYKNSISILNLVRYSLHFTTLNFAVF